MVSETEPLEDVQDIRVGRLYTTGQVAGLFGVSAETVRVWHRSGRLRAADGGGHGRPLRFLGSDLYALIRVPLADMMPETETVAQRKKRADAARRRFAEVA